LWPYHYYLQTHLLAKFLFKRQEALKASWLFFCVYFIFLHYLIIISTHKQMIDTSILFLATEKEGGLFDLDGTLPLIAIQFLALMFLLNLILYTPLLNVINDRNQYINKNLASASTTLSQSKQLIQQYEKELAKARKEAQVEISTLQKLHKTILETETKLSQKLIDEFLTKFTTNLKIKKEKVLLGLENEIDSLSSQIISKILA
jgi:F-type H+-transporting ATPase subunit b